MTSNSVLAVARTHLLGYCRLMSENFEIPPHVRLIAQKLEAVERGELKRLIITVPPRHGKSWLCSQFFPAWYMGRNPEKYLITSTYGQELSDDFGRRVRDQLIDPLFQATFPNSKLRTDTQASARMQTEAGGLYFGVGVGGPATGRGADLLIIDDPVRNREEADSLDRLNKINAWYGSVAYTRLMPQGAIIVIMTRWADADLVGHLLLQEHENWDVVHLKAIGDDGAALWPDRYSAADLQRIKATIGERDFSCLYQGEPLAAEFTVFRPDWIIPSYKPIKDLDICATYMGVDLAFSKRQEADESALCIGGLDYNGAIHELETIHGRMSGEELHNAILSAWKRHNIQLIGVEKVAAQQLMIDRLKAEGLPVVELPADMDKRRRAMSVQHLFERNKVYVNTKELQAQMLKFTGINDKHDDYVDALVYMLKTVGPNIEELIVKYKDPYKHLSPDQRAVWQAIHAERGQGQSQQSAWNDPPLSGQDSGDYI